MAHCVGLTRKIWLNDEGTDVKMRPIDALRTLEGTVLADAQNLTLEQANDMLADVKGDMLYIRAALTVNDAKEFGIWFKSNGDSDRTSYTYNIETETIAGDTRNKGSAASLNHVSGSLPLEDGKLVMEIYIDRSLVEGFFNDTKSISMRSYSDYDSQGIQLFSDGNLQVESLYVAGMQSIYSE